MSALTVSVAICTRNRGSEIEATIKSILASTVPYQQLIVVDQSADDITQRAVSQFLHNCCFVYHRSTTIGLGAARNVALSLTSSDILVFTDDDCLVTPNWLEGHLKVFNAHPKVLLTYGMVSVPDYDRTLGYIPGYQLTADRHVHNFREKSLARGIGANTAVRRSILTLLGGYDNLFGPGGIMKSADDVDMTIRVVMKSWEVYETTESTVLHNGYRDRAAGRKHSTNDMIGIGSACAKPFRRGRWDAWCIVNEEFGRHTLQPFLRSLMKSQKPLGFYRLTGFLIGFSRGLCYQVDSETFQFVHPLNSRDKLQ